MQCMYTQQTTVFENCLENVRMCVPAPWICLWWTNREIIQRTFGFIFMCILLDEQDQVFFLWYLLLYSVTGLLAASILSIDIKWHAPSISMMY